MGGMGSGRYGGRPVVDGCRSLDVNRLHREGCLRPGWFGDPPLVARRRAGGVHRTCERTRAGHAHLSLPMLR